MTSGTESMADEDFGEDTRPVEFTEHIDTGLARQDATAMNHDATTTKERIEGIREQTRLDMVGREREEIVEVLGERFSDAGIEFRDDEIEAMARSISRDVSQLPEGTYEAYREQVEPE